MVSPSDAYALFGVGPNASSGELKRAYRRALRRAHPDQGGTTEKFAAVQAAWEALDSADPSPSGSSRVPRPERRSATAPPERVVAKSHGHPGGWFRERYGIQVREWLGRGVEVDNVFDPSIVKRAPAEVAHILQAAIAEEETAAILKELGPAYEVWHDVLVEGSRDHGAQKIDHVVLGPTRLWALQSEDWGSSLEVSRGEISGEGLASQERPVKELMQMVKKLQRSTGVKFSGMAYVAARDQVPHPVTVVITKGRLPCFLVARSAIVDFLQEDAPVGARSLVGDDLFPLRERLRATLRFV